MPPSIVLVGENHAFNANPRFVLPAPSAGDVDRIAFARAQDPALKLAAAGYLDLCPAPKAQAQMQREAIRAALDQIDMLGLDDGLGATPLVYAVIADDLANLRRFPDIGYPVNRQRGVLLLDAAMHASGPVIDDLLRRGIPIDTVDDHGTTALMVAAGQQRTDTVRFLLARGADPNLRNRDGGSALGYALVCGYTDSAQTLLQGGAEIDAKVLQIAGKVGVLEQVQNFRRDQ